MTQFSDCNRGIALVGGYVSFILILKRVGSNLEISHYKTIDKTTY